MKHGVYNNNVKLSIGFGGSHIDDVGIMLRETLRRIEGLSFKSRGELYVNAGQILHGRYLKNPEIKRIKDRLIQAVKAKKK